MPDKPLKNISVLLVEDNEMNTLLASAILSRTGASITEAGNGKDAITYLQQRSFDVILMDLHLPVMNGFETTRYIRETLKLDTPIIAITANIINDEESKCINAGMNAFISKPYTEKNLIEKISSCRNISKHNKETTDTITETAPLYNLNTLKTLTRNDQELIKAMIRAFINQVPVSSQALNTALANKNFKDIYSAAHSIKPNIDTLEITSLKTIIRQIELLATEEKDFLELDFLIAQLLLTLDKVVAQLNNILSSKII